ncbi:MAG TPA: hypothetical protein PKC67_03300 [Kiritimatiellia bacterium]|nr:hypothetical protein [Kiritimatiellia bacterium]HMP33353.1 hypothetical protein [Kiritimatiellia bacterium]
MPETIRYIYHFHPVGQGLFASGILLPWRDGQMPFHWVFDCGSMANDRDCIPQVRPYRDLVLRDDVLNLLCISHFDKDHVSGLAELLAGRHVDTVVIPYYTPIERLVIGSVQESRRRGGGDDGEYHDFLSNPAAFIIERAASVRQILFVYRTHPEDPAWPYGDGMDPDSPLWGLEDRPFNRDRQHDKHDVENKSWGVKVWEPRIPGESPRFAHGLKDSLSTWPGIVGFVGENCNLRAVDLLGKNYLVEWEFLFFHKPEHPDRITRLIGRIDSILHAEAAEFGFLPTLANALGNKRIRDKIKGVYKAVFPDSKRFNSSGLCMYSGPLADYLQWSHISCAQVWHGLPPLGSSSHDKFGFYEHVHVWRPGILYSGDADYQPSAHRIELRKFLTEDRWRNIHILQVPHHGSRYNWEVGSSNEFAHSWSVFCADPEKKDHHPHQEVVLDLLTKNPILVDRIAGACWNGLCHFDDISRQSDGK